MTTANDGLAGGRLNAALANEIGKLIADFTGRGATKSRAFLYQDMVVCLLENGATKAEVNLAARGGRARAPAAGRGSARDGTTARAAVQRLTGRTVRIFLSGTSTPGEDSVEVFVLEPRPANSRTPVSFTVLGPD